MEYQEHKEHLLQKINTSQKFIEMTKQEGWSLYLDGIREQISVVLKDLTVETEHLKLLKLQAEYVVLNRLLNMQRVYEEALLLARQELEDVVTAQTYDVDASLI